MSRTHVLLVLKSEVTEPDDANGFAVHVRYATDLA